GDSGAARIPTCGAVVVASGPSFGISDNGSGVIDRERLTPGEGATRSRAQIAQLNANARRVPTCGALSQAVVIRRADHRAAVVDCVRPTNTRGTSIRCRKTQLSWRRARALPGQRDFILVG